MWWVAEVEEPLCWWQRRHSAWLLTVQSSWWQNFFFFGLTNSTHTSLIYLTGQCSQLDTKMISVVQVSGVVEFEIMEKSMQLAWGDVITCRAHKSVQLMSATVVLCCPSVTSPIFALEVIGGTSCLIVETVQNPLLFAFICSSSFFLQTLGELEIFSHLQLPTLR